MQKIQKKTTLMKCSKDQLVEQIIMLEKNIVNIQQSFDIQYQNCMKIVDDMKLLNETYESVMKNEVQYGQD